MSSIKEEKSCKASYSNKQKLDKVSITNPLIFAHAAADVLFFAYLQTKIIPKINICQPETEKTGRECACELFAHT